MILGFELLSLLMLEQETASMSITKLLDFSVTSSVTNIFGDSIFSSDSNGSDPEFTFCKTKEVHHLESEE